jgi:hypothetical protein
VLALHRIWGPWHQRKDASFSEAKEAKRLLFLAQLHVSRPMITADEAAPRNKSLFASFS